MSWAQRSAAFPSCLPLLLVCPLALTLALPSSPFCDQVTISFISLAFCLYILQAWNFLRLNRIRDNLSPEQRQAWIDEGREGDSHPDFRCVFVCTSWLQTSAHPPPPPSRLKVPVLDAAAMAL